MGTRVDIRKHTKHVLRPDPKLVEAFLRSPSDERAAARFANAYRRSLQERFAADSSAFEALADAAREGDVYLGCSCPTKRQPDVMRCHTVLALRFFAEHFDDIDVRMPDPSNALPGGKARDKKRA